MASQLTRRRLLRGAAAAAGAIALGFSAPRILRAAGPQWGDLVGRFVYDGIPPERKKLKVDKDVDCCGKFDVRDESLMVGPGGGLANVFVYAWNRKIDVCPELAAAVPKRVTLDNKDCIFVPHCVPLWVGKQEFHMVNNDPVAQNIAFSPLGELPANIILSPAPGKNVDAAYKFTRPQINPVPIACNYHPWESAYVLPRGNPYAAVCGPDGTFRIVKLPVGKVEFQAWQERVGYLGAPGWTRGRFEVTIEPGTTDLGTVKIAPAKLEKK
jgi:hypothetical protein